MELTVYKNSFSEGIMNIFLQRMLDTLYSHSALLSHNEWSFTESELLLIDPLKAILELFKEYVASITRLYKNNGAVLCVGNYFPFIPWYMAWGYL